MTSLNGVPITSAKVFIPAWGVWWADVEVSEPDPLTGTATLVIADRTMRGTITSGGTLYGRGRYRVAGGAGRWGEEIPAAGYHNDLGVKVSTVVQDAARLVGETIEGVDDARAGVHFARAAGPASDVLNRLTRDAWHVDDDGVTRFGAREVYAFEGEGAVELIDSAQGIVSIATDSVANIRPGISALGVTSSDIEIDVSPSAIRVRLYSRQVTDAWRQMAARLAPHLRYAGTWEYRVVSQSGERLNVQPTRVASGVPDLSRVPVRPGVPGFRATWGKGSLCLVAFVNADPSRPVIIGGDAPDSPGWVPDELTLRAADMRVDVLDSLITIAKEGSSSDFVALADKVDTALADFRSWANSHMHPTAGTGAPSPPAEPLPAASSTAASHVKAS